MRSMGIGKKPTMLAGSKTSAVLVQLSKGALIDYVADLLTRIHGEEPDDEALAVMAVEEFNPVSLVRGDRLPRMPDRHAPARLLPKDSRPAAWGEEGEG